MKPTKEQIENEYQSLLQSPRYPQKLKARDAILRVMENNPQKIWWFGYDFMGMRDGFLFSHKACTRLGELAKGGVLEAREVGNQKVYRYIWN